MKIAVFSGSEILRIVVCPPDSASKQAKNGEGWIELPDDFEGTDETHEVKDGMVVPK